MAVSAEVATLFLEEMERRKVPVTLGADGGYEIAMDGDTVATIRLEYLSRDFAQDRDPDRVTHFVDTILASIRVPDWTAAQSRIRWALEPTDMPLEDALHDVVSDQVALVLVHVSPDETQVMWVTPSMAEGWGQTKESLMEAATGNMQALLREAHIPFEQIDDHKLGMLHTEYTAFKAALVFCPGLKAIAEPVLGWPIFAVMPCRDFVYLIGEADSDLLGRVGPVVVKEYGQGAYPLCTEVFKITDDGIAVIGAFERQPRGEAEPEEDADGMKTIEYRGGVATFRVPTHWEEEYEDEGGGTFYDEDADTGTLRLNVLLAKAKSPVTTKTSKEMGEKRAKSESGTAEELADGNWLVRYTQETEEDGDDLTIHYWEIVNPLPPAHIRIALFSYTMRTELLEDDDVAAELALLERELRACRFAAEIGE